MMKLVKGFMELTEDYQGGYEEALTELYECAKQCFCLRGGGEYSREVHDLWMMSKEPHINKVMLYRDKDEGGKVVGFVAWMRFVVDVDGKNHIVYRSIACLLKEYRGTSKTFSFALSELLKDKLLHPFTPIAYVDSLDLSAYALFAKYIHELYPSCYRKISPKRLATIQKLATTMGIELKDADNPWVSPCGIISIRSSGKWTESGITRFFSELVPDCDTQGDGIIVFSPVTVTNLIGTFSRIFASGLLKRLTGRRRMSACDLCFRGRTCERHTMAEPQAAC